MPFSPVLFSHASLVSGTCEGKHRNCPTTLRYLEKHPAHTSCKRNPVLQRHAHPGKKKRTEHPQTHPRAHTHTHTCKRRHPLTGRTSAPRCTRTRSRSGGRRRVQTAAGRSRGVPPSRPSAVGLFPRRQPHPGRRRRRRRRRVWVCQCRRRQSLSLPLSNHPPKAAVGFPEGGGIPVYIVVRVVSWRFFTRTHDILEIIYATQRARVGVAGGEKVVQRFLPDLPFPWKYA